MSCFVQSHTVSFGHCHSNPGHLHTVSCLNQCCDHATRATMGLEFVVLAERILDRTAIGGNNEAIGMELLRCQLTHLHRMLPFWSIGTPTRRCVKKLFLRPYS